MLDAKCHQALGRNQVTELFGQPQLMQRRFWTECDARFAQALSDCDCREGGGSAFGSRNGLGRDIRIGTEFEAILIYWGGSVK